MDSYIVRKLQGIANMSSAGAGLLTAVVSIAGVTNASRMLAQSAQSATVLNQKFEVVSVRPCETDQVTVPSGRSGGGVAVAAASPGSLRLNCTTLAELITAAYVRFANGRRNLFYGRPVPGPRGITTVAAIEGGPAWINSERYDINAKADGAPRYEIMNGPMLQALLEDRFKLKIHRDTREIPTFTLNVASSRPKLQQSKEGGCVPRTETPTPPVPGSKPVCGTVGIGRKAPSDPTLTVNAFAMSVAEFPNFLSGNLSRPIVDKTGIFGTFDFHLEFAPDEATPGLRFSGGRATSPDSASGPTIFTAIQEQLGLKLEAAKGASEFLVIDHVERPSEN